MSEEFKAKIRRSAEAWVGKLDAVDEVCAPDVVYHIPPFPDLVGVKAQKDFVGAFHMAFPDFQVTFDEDVVEGSTSVHRWHCEATYTGQSPLLPIPPTGKHTTASGCHVVHWQGGKAVEVWHFGDWLGWLQRAGVIPPMG